MQHKALDELLASLGNNALKDELVDSSINKTSSASNVKGEKKLLLIQDFISSKKGSFDVCYETEVLNDGQTKLVVRSSTKQQQSQIRLHSPNGFLQTSLY